MPAEPRIEPLPGGFGAVIAGLDLRHPLDTASSAAIHEALAQHAVVVFPAQSLRQADLVAVSRALGEPVVHHVSAYQGDGHPEIMVLSNNIENGKPLGAPNNGVLWHSDHIYKARPVSYTLLYGHEVPPIAGDTLFADMRAAADALSARDRADLAARTARHSFAESYRKNYLAAAPLTEAMCAANPDVDHPVLRTHPSTGRAAVFVDPDSTISISGLAPADNDATLARLFAFLDDPALLYRHRWRQGDLVIWDNRCLMHRATGYDDSSHRRVMWRTQLAGEVPH